MSSGVIIARVVAFAVAVPVASVVVVDRWLWWWYGHWRRRRLWGFYRSIRNELDHYTTECGYCIDIVDDVVDRRKASVRLRSAHVYGDPDVVGRSRTVLSGKFL